MGATEMRAAPRALAEPLDEMRQLAKSAGDDLLASQLELAGEGAHDTLRNSRVTMTVRVN